MVKIELTGPQALVLFEWLARESSKQTLSFEDLAEQQLLWIVEGQLEKALLEPFSENYSELVANARAQVRDNPRG